MEPVAPPARSALTAAEPGAYASLLSTPPRPPAAQGPASSRLACGRGKGRARPARVTSGLSALAAAAPPPPGAWQGPTAPTQLESQATTPAQEAGRDLRPRANSPLSYPLGSGGLSIFPNACYGRRSEEEDLGSPHTV